MNIIFDLDGTLALVDHRRHLVDGSEGKKDFDAFHRACVDDPPNMPIIKLTRYFALLSFHIEIWSGRSSAVRQQTTDWLTRNEVKFDVLRMRRTGDYTPDNLLKEFWFDNWLGIYKPPEGLANNLLVFDDRDKVVAMWRRRGITCCQVAEGDF